MIFDLSNVLDRERFKARSNKLYSEGRIVELTDKALRSVSQNSYLHLIITWHAMESGNTVEWVKQKYFKELVNPDIFVVKKQDKHLGETIEIVSSTKITKEQMTTAIDRLKMWSAREGIYLPDSDNKEFLTVIAVQESKHKQWL